MVRALAALTIHSFREYSASHAVERVRLVPATTSPVKHPPVNVVCTGYGKHMH